MAHTKVTKTYSQNTGAANTFSYSGSFDVFKATEVEVELDNVKLTYTASTINESASPREYTVDASAKTVHIGGADLSSGTVVIQPVTDMGAPTPRADYAPGSSITSEDLNNNQLQLMRKAMEYDEQKLSSRGGTMTGNITLAEDITIIFEGATDDAYETTLTVADPTADRTITLPNVTGTVVTTGDTGTVTATMLAANSVDSSELVDGSIDTSHISSGAVTTAKLAADVVTGAKIADDAINSEHYADGSIDAAHIADGNISSAKIADGNVTTTKIADDAVRANHIHTSQVLTAAIADSNVTTAKIADANVTTAKLAADAVTSGKLADNAVVNANLTSDCVTSDNLADNSVTTVQITDANVTTAKIADSNITAAKIADGNISSAKIADGNITTAKISDAQVTSAKLAAGAVTTVKISDLQVTTAKIADDSISNAKMKNNAITAAEIADDVINSRHYVAGSVDTEHIADANVTTAKIADANVTTAKITDSNVTTAKIADDAITIAKVGCEQTTISDSDSHIPTSGAVVDYVAAQIAPIGGLEVIADEDNFPSTQPSSGVVISISDAGGVVVNGSGVSTTARTAGNGSDNVTINNFPSDLQSTTLAAGVGLMVTSTGSSNTYNYHKALLKEADLKNLSSDIDDFGNRYRVHNGEPSSNNDDGDLVWDTNANKMKVYDATASAWTEVTSTGDFKFLVPVDAGTTTAATWDGSDTSFDLKETTNSGSAASVSNINQLIVSLNGVIQKPNTGSYSASEEGFYLTDSDTIRFCTAPPSGSSAFIIQCGSAVSIPTPGDGTVTTAKIASAAVTTAKIAKPLDFADNEKARFGTGTDLEVYSAGTGGLIKTNNGALTIATASLHINNAADSEQCIHTTEDGSVELFYDDSKKLETKSWGVEIPTNQALIAQGSSAYIKVQDSGKFYAGNDEDLQIYHDGSHSNIINKTGNLYINASASDTALKIVPDGAVELYNDNVKVFQTHANGARVIGTEGASATFYMLADEGDDNADYWRLLADEGSCNFKLQNQNSGSWETNLRAVGDGATELYYDNVKKLETASYGITMAAGTRADFNGNIKLFDNSIAYIGTGNDLQIIHDGSHSRISAADGGDGRLIISGRDGSAGDIGLQLNAEDSEESILCKVDGAVELYYDGTKRFETTNTGVQVTGNIDIDGNIDGADGSKLKLGTGDDLEIYHSGSQSKISHDGAGDLEIETLGSGENILIDASEHVLLRTSGNENAVYCTKNAGVGLYYDDALKCVTTSSGITVTGSVSTNDINMSNLNAPTPNEVDGTRGTWTMQEGANDLFLINRSNGKKYKFNLTEVS